MIRSLAAASLSLALAGCAGMGGTGAAGGVATATAESRAGDPLVARLAEGGYVLYFRHGKTDSSFQDKKDKPDWWKSCDTRSHRPLSDAGRAQMQSIGNHIRALKIPVAKVLTSEYCRAVDSGLLLQLMPVEQDDSLNFSDAQRFVKRSDEQIAGGLRTLFSTPPSAAHNTILVGHVHTFAPSIDPIFSQLQEAEAVVMKPQGEGRFEIVGRIGTNKWALRQ